MRPSFTSLILLLAISGILWGQRPPRAGGPGIGGRRPSMAAPGDRSPLERWNRMSPQQRERALRQLPPERRKSIEERLAKFNSMPKGERARLTQRYERFAELTPEKQELLRRQMREFRDAPDDRRPALAREFRRLRGMTEADRRSRVESDEFRHLFSAEEQQMLRDLSENLSPAPK